MLKAITAAFGLGATAFAARIAGRIAGPFAAVVAAGLLALSPTWAFSQVSGMEVCFTGCLLLAAWDTERHAGPLFALACLGRPEVAVFAPLIVWRSGWRSMVAPALAAALWAAVNMGITGLPLPATFYAKSIPFDARRLPLLGRVLWESWPWLGIGCGPMLVLLAVGRGLQRRRWELPLATGLALAFLAVIAGFRLLSPDSTSFYFLRYNLPVEPVLAVGVAVGAADVPARWRWTLALVGTALIAVTVPSMTLRRTLYAWNCQNIEEMNGAAARWIAANTPRDAVVASVDAGLVRYIGERRTLDIVGLNHHALLFDHATWNAILSNPAAMNRWMKDQGADWLVVFPNLLPFTQKGAATAAAFEVVHRYSSQNYTVAGQEQNLLMVLHRREMGAQAGDGATLEPPRPLDPARP